MTEIGNVFFFSEICHFLSDGNLESTGGSNVPICLLDDQLKQLLFRAVQGEDIFLCKSVKYFGIVYCSVFS